MARELVQRFIARPFTEPVLLNVNVPSGSYESLQGTLVTRLGKRHKAEPMVREVTPRGDPVFWIGPAGGAADAGAGTDFHAVEHGYVSISPLQIDLTHARQIEPVANWLEGR